MPDKTPLLFTAPDTWHGGEIALDLELGPVSDEQIMAALEAIWLFPGMEGCYADREIEPEAQERLAPTFGVGSLGVVILPDGVRLACATCTYTHEDGTVWVDFYVPVGALSNAYSEVGSYPFSKNVEDATVPMAWEKNLEDFMRHMAYAVYEAVPYRLGLIGFDVGGETCHSDVDKNGVPTDRYSGYLVPHDGKLNWYAPTRYGASYTVL